MISIFWFFPQTYSLIQKNGDTFASVYSSKCVTVFLNQTIGAGLQSTIIDKWEMHFMKSIWSNLEMIHWICALKSWFLLHFSFIFVYVLPWNDIIKWQGKNLHGSDIRNYFHHISCNTSTSSDYFSCRSKLCTTPL